MRNEKKKGNRMSVKSRVTKLENSLPRPNKGLCSREQFDMRVDRLKVSMARFGYQLTDEDVKAYAYELLKTRPNFAGLGFDPAVLGLNEVGAS